MGGRLGPMIAIREALKRFEPKKDDKNPKKDDRKMYFGGIRQFRESDIKVLNSMQGGSFGLVRLFTTENESNVLYVNIYAHSIILPQAELVEVHDEGNVKKAVLKIPKNVTENSFKCDIPVHWCK